MKSKCCNAELKVLVLHDGLYNPSGWNLKKFYHCTKCGLMYKFVEEKVNNNDEQQRKRNLYIE